MGRKGQDRYLPIRGSLLMLSWSLLSNNTVEILRHVFDAELISVQRNELLSHFSSNDLKILPIRIFLLLCSLYTFVCTVDFDSEIHNVLRKTFYIAF